MSARVVRQAFQTLDRSSAVLGSIRASLEGAWAASKVASSLRGNSRAAEVLIEGETPKAYLAHRKGLRTSGRERSFFVERVVLLPGHTTGRVCRDVMRRVHALARGESATHITIETVAGEVFTEYLAEVAERQRLRAESSSRSGGVTRHTFRYERLDAESLHKQTREEVARAGRRLLEERGRAAREEPRARAEERREGPRARAGERREERRQAPPRDMGRDRPAERGPVVAPRAPKRRRNEEPAQAERGSGVSRDSDKRSRLSHRPRVERAAPRDPIVRAAPQATRVREHRLPMKGVVYLNAIMDGSKPFEGRINGAACKRMQVGDNLRMFDRRAGWGIVCQIVSKDVYYSFEEMLRAKGTLKMLPQLSRQASYLNAEQLLEAGAAIYKRFPGAQRVTRQGCTAIGVKFLHKV